VDFRLDSKEIDLLVYGMASETIANSVKIIREKLLTKSSDYLFS
jgi:hypothetical protein